MGGCNVSPSPTDVPDQKFLNVASHGESVPWLFCPWPNHPIPKIRFDWAKRHLTSNCCAALALRSGGVLCVGRACIQRRGANPINLVIGVDKTGQMPHWSIRCRRPTEQVPCFTRSRVGTHWSGAQYPRDALFKGHNIQEFSVGDTWSGTHQPCMGPGIPLEVELFRTLPTENSANRPV